MTPETKANMHHLSGSTLLNEFAKAIVWPERRAQFLLLGIVVAVIAGYFVLENGHPDAIHLLSK